MRLRKITGPVRGARQTTRFLSWTGRLITSAALILYFAFAVRSLRARRPRCSPPLGVGVLLSATLAAGRCAGLAFCRPGLGTRLGVMRASRPWDPGAAGRGRQQEARQALLRARNAAELLRSLGIRPAPEGTRQILQDVREQLAEIRGAAFGEG